MQAAGEVMRTYSVEFTHSHKVYAQAQESCAWTFKGAERQKLHLGTALNASGTYASMRVPHVCASAASWQWCSPLCLCNEQERKQTT